jgi:hypothetical protein
MNLWRLPRILVVHLKRFQVVGRLIVVVIIVVFDFVVFLHSLNLSRYREKLDNFVDCPIDGLDLTPYVLNADEGAVIYRLYAVVVSRF